MLKSERSVGYEGGRLSSVASAQVGVVGGGCFAPVTLQNLSRDSIRAEDIARWGV